MFNNLKRHIKIVILLFFPILSLGQNDSLIYNSIQLDTLTIFAKNEFDTKAFINHIKEDTTFYQSFKNLRFYPHKATGEIKVYNKKNNEKAAEKISVAQHLSKNKMWQTKKIISSSGKLRNRKGDYRFTTAELYYNVFFPNDTIPVSTQLTKVKDEPVGKGKKQEYRHDIKLMMFNPGEDINNVPIVGKKMSIFDDDMIQYYDYKVSQLKYKGFDCYQFSCIAKPEFKENKTVTKYLVTLFEKETLAVLKREYVLRYKSVLFQFDVTINVINSIEKNVIVPTKIIYDGYWDIPFKTQEKIDFKIENTNYELSN